MQDQHRMFLQSFMSRGILDGRQVKELYKLVYEKTGLPPAEIKHLAEFVLTINSNVKPYHMEIKKGIDEHDGTNFYCLVNLEESDISRQASKYSQVELDYFRKIIEEIVCSSTEGSLSSTDALNLTEELRGGKTIKKKDAESLIGRLCEERWLARTDGQILLTPRTLMEFDHYITEMYPEDSILCECCRKLVVKGQNCTQCQVRMHAHCAKKFFRPENPKCPQCNEAWRHEIVRPAKVARTHEEGTQEPTQTQSREAPTRKSSRR